MKDKRRFDNIVNTFKPADRIRYVRSKKGKEKCRLHTTEINKGEFTSFIAINLDSKVYHIATTLSVWFIEYIVYAIKK